MEWIMSEGGPLICTERRFETSWGGIYLASCCASGSEKDYDRACKVSTYLSSIQVKDGAALIIGEAPLDTSVWSSPAGELYIVRVTYADPQADFVGIMSGIVSSVFDSPEEVLDFSFSSSELVIFDSAEPGNILDKKP